MDRGRFAPSSSELEGIQEPSRRRHLGPFEDPPSGLADSGRQGHVSCVSGAFSAFPSSRRLRCSGCRQRRSRGGNPRRRSARAPAPSARPAASSRPPLRRRGESAREGNGAGRLRRKRPDRTDLGARRLETVVENGGADPRSGGQRRSCPKPAPRRHEPFVPDVRITSGWWI